MNARIKAFFRTCCLLVLLMTLIQVGPAFAQLSKGQTTLEGRDNAGKRPPNESLLLLITHKPTKVLYGNPCVETYTKQLGFIYAPYYGESFWTDFGTNFQTHWKMFWRHGFGWKRGVKKRIKQCRVASGDRRHL